MMTNYIFSATSLDMTEHDVLKLLDPRGPQLQAALRGAPNEARVAVTVHWEQIKQAIEAGYTTKAIFKVLSEAGLLSISLRSFHRQVQARRKGARGLESAAKPAIEPRPSDGSAGLSEAAKGEAPALGDAREPEPAEVTPTRPRRSWRTGPYVPPDPTKVFRPRDPLADD